MSINVKTIATTVKQVANVVMSDSGQKFLCGTYSNGEPRSVVDAMRDEYVSPDDRAKWDKKKKKKKKRDRLIQSVSFFTIRSWILCISVHSGIDRVVLYHITYPVQN